MSRESTVIRPPIEDVARGKVFRPDVRFRNKMWFTGIFIAVGIWLILTFTILFGGYVGHIIAGPGNWTTFWVFFDSVWGFVNFWYWIITAVWFIPGAILVPIYLNSIEYSVVSQEHKVMPEIYVKKGIITVSRKHVPFRNITHIASRAGPFDRLFGIGVIEIETAGHSGSMQTGPEEKLEGIVFYEELRDFILRELRKFKDPYVTGTEVVTQDDDISIMTGGTLEEEILIVLREIRDLLRERR